MLKVRVKICCIANRQEAETAIRFGASALGLVGAMPSGPGVISDEAIQAIALGVPPPVATFLLTSETRTEKIISHYQRVNTTAIQLVDELPGMPYGLLKVALPHVKLVQVIHVSGESSLRQAMEVAPHVDAILLDSGNPNLRVKELGGTGRTHDWEISRQIRDRVSVPVFLAGGLNPENVKRAIDVVQPFGVDVCSGVRTDGLLDEREVEAFFKAVGY